MQAIIQTGGQQFAVKEGDVILVDLLKDASVGGDVTFEDVRFIGGGENPKIGTPRLEGAKVTGTVLAEAKGKKVRAVFMRRRKDSKTVKGHRQRYHRVRITGITG